VQNGEDSTTWLGYLEALRKARARFRSLGCTATDHGHPLRKPRISTRGKLKNSFIAFSPVMAMRNSMSSSARKC